MYFPPVKNIDQFTKDPTLKALRPWWMVSIGAALLYLVPAQAVLETPMVGSLINWLASLIPSIARWVELSPFPHNTKLFAVFVWLMILMQFFWLVKDRKVKTYYRQSYRNKASAQSNSVRVAAFILFITFFSIYILTAANLAIVDTLPCRVCVNTSPLAQLFIGCINSVAISGLVAFTFLVSPEFFNLLTQKGCNHVK